MTKWMRAFGVAGVLMTTFFLAGAAAQDGDGDADKGKTVYEENCSLCHLADSEEANIGPGLKGLFQWETHTLSDGTEHETHTVELIRDQIVNGSSAMPPLGDSIAEEQMNDLLAYLQTL